MSQIEYLEILFNDCGFDRAKRKAWVAFQLKRPVAYLDELSTAERSYLIDRLKEMKEAA